MRETSDKSASVSDEVRTVQNAGGMNERQSAYMRAGATLVPTSVPVTTSKYLNSPLFAHAFTTMSLRRFGKDVPCTYDVPDMSRGLADVTDHVAGARLIAQEREKNGPFDDWIRARRPVCFEASKLARHAPGTLGHAIHEFVTASGMDMHFVHDFEPNNDLEYVIQTIGHSHDLQHLISGFGPNLAGEHALAMLNCTANSRFLSPGLAHHLSLANYFVSSAQISRVFFNYPEATPLLLTATKLGIEAGEHVKMPMFMVDFDAYLDWQMEDISRDLGFTRGPGTDWAYSDQLMAD